MDHAGNGGQADGRQGVAEQEEQADVAVKPALLQTMASCKSLEPRTTATYTLQLCPEEDSEEEAEEEGPAEMAEDGEVPIPRYKRLEQAQPERGNRSPTPDMNKAGNELLQRQQLLQERASARSAAPSPPPPPPTPRTPQSSRTATDQPTLHSPSPSNVATTLLTQAHRGASPAAQYSSSNSSSNDSSSVSLGTAKALKSPSCEYEEHGQLPVVPALPQQWPTSPDARAQEASLHAGKPLLSPSPEPPQQQPQQRQHRYPGRNCTPSPLRMPSTRHFVNSPGWTPTSTPCDTPLLLFGRSHSTNTSNCQSPDPAARTQGAAREQPDQNTTIARPLPTPSGPHTPRSRTASLAPQKELVKRAISQLARAQPCTQDAIAFAESLVLSHRHMVLPPETLMKELLRVYNMDDVDNSLSETELSALRHAVISFLRIWWQHQSRVPPKVRKWMHRLERLCVLEGFTHKPAIITGQAPQCPLAASPLGAHNRFASKSFSPLLETPSRQLAEHLTLLDFEGYRALTAAEIFDEVWKGSCPAVWRVRNSTLQLSRWVAASVLRQKYRRDRVAVLSQWIQAAVELKSMASFNALFGVILGITGHAVRRLSETLSMLPTHLMEHLRMLRELKPKGQHIHAYRDLLHEAQDAAEQDPSRLCIPFMGVVFQDLSALHARFLQSRHRSTGSSAQEFEILQEMRVVITRYLQYQSRSIPFKIDHQLLGDLTLATRVHWSNEELLEMSQACEPVLLEGVRCVKVQAREKIKVACCGSPAPEAFSAWLRTKEPAAVMKALQQAGFSVPSRRLTSEDLEGGIKHLANQIFSRYCPAQQHMDPSTWRVVRVGIPLLPMFEDLDEYGDGVVYPHALASYLKEIQLFSTFKCLPHIFERQTTRDSLVCDFCSETLRHVLHRCRDCGQSVHGRCRVLVSRNCIPNTQCATRASVVDGGEHAGRGVPSSGARTQCEALAADACSESNARISEASESLACRQISDSNHESAGMATSAPLSSLAPGTRVRRRADHVAAHRQLMASTSDGRRVLVTMTGTRIRDV